MWYGHEVSLCNIRFPIGGRKLKTSKLIGVDGIPGSGKSTTGEWISSRLNSSRVANRFYHEMENGHPLRIYDKTIKSLVDPDEADWFTNKVTQLFSSFVCNQLNSETVLIIEAYVFQDTV
jgi:thymidylate kinase